MDRTDSFLAAQYEAFPYPKRDPRDEKKRLVVGSPSHLREVDHWVFAARRPASQPLRALVAGGGTGDGAIMLATQLARAGRPGSVTYLDRSAAAAAVARARAEARGLANMLWHEGSLLDLPGSGLGPFDYIDCCGVLHHLPDPDAGLRALLAVLAPGGGMGLMVYAPHGRTGVYMLQDALNRLAPPDESPTDRLDVARRVMKHLPDSAWLRRNMLFADHLTGGDAGLYDLLLNPRDRAYDVSSLLALLDGAGLRPTALMEPRRYDPGALLPDGRLRTRLDRMSWGERAAVAEALAGNMSTHVVYCVRAGDEVRAPDPLHPQAVPVGREMPGPELAGHIGRDGTLPVLFDGLRVPLALPPLAPALLRLVDGATSVGAMAAAMAGRGTGPDAFERAWRTTFEALQSVNRVLLTAPSGSGGA